MSSYPSARSRRLRVARAVRTAAAIVALLAAGSIAAPAARAQTEATRTTYHTTKVAGLDVFYRAAGRADAPVVVLLHGFPSSSHMFRDLIPALADRYRVIAPDFPAFGMSAMPARGQFPYGFAAITDVVDELLQQLGARHYALYVMDYGAPVGYRLALKHPERVTAFIVQNGNAYTDGMREFWKPIKAYWASGSATDREALRAGTTLDATRWQYLDGVRDSSRVDPGTWVHDQALLDRPGNIEIQLDLFKDYATNVALYPRIQAYFREHQPPMLIVWGKNDVIFPAEGAKAYLRDLPSAELHLLDTGHFALEDKGEEIARLMRDFLARRVSPAAATGSERPRSP